LEPDIGPEQRITCRARATFSGMWLTKPTRARLALWLALAFLWFLLLP